MINLQNWSPYWKASAIFCSTLVSFAQGLGPLALVRNTYFLRYVKSTADIVQAPMFGDYIEAFGHDLADVVQFTGVAILVLGFSNFIWYAHTAPILEFY